MSKETSYLWRSEPEPLEEVTDHREDGIGLCLYGVGLRGMQSISPLGLGIRLPIQQIL